MRMRILVSVITAILVSSMSLFADELGRFEIEEPLGKNWPGEWIKRQVSIDTSNREVAIVSLRAVQTGDESAEETIPVQFYRGNTLLKEGSVKGKETLGVLCRVSLKKDQTIIVKIVEDAGQDRLRSLVWVGRERGGLSIPLRDADEALQSGWKLSVINGYYGMTFEHADEPLWKSIAAVAMFLSGQTIVFATFSVPAPQWPVGVLLKSYRTEVLENGPVRAVIRRVFEFDDPARHYEITFDMRDGDPWIGVHEKYDLGEGTFIKIDLSSLNPDVVYHPHTYNARTFGHDGKSEDTTLQPPQHPIATLSPIWRDIWFGGGSHAFVYNSQSKYGIGFAAVKGSEWKAKDGVSLRSQSLSVNGDKETPGKVWVKLPTDGGERHWAIIAGPIDIRKDIKTMIRSHADIPLQTVLDEWVLDWDSKNEQQGYGMAGAWFGSFNQHQLNPTTFPRRVRSHLSNLIKEGKKVKSRDLAMLAYVFMDPDYWPGPEYKWGNIGNPNFHTDMYNVPLQIGLVMPDHPHAKRWLKYGVDELHSNVMRDSYQGGAWAESLSYSQFFFHIAEYARNIHDAGIADPFKDWGRLKEVANYVACMHTPVDPRYGSRQKAPIGDTHPGNYIEHLRKAGGYYRGIDNKFAEQLERFGEKWPGAIDLSSRAFYGFGAMLRGNPYNDRHESFVTVKAGPARNHYQGDELSFHFCSLATPLAIDYACHYSPRPWSASMHNRPDMNGLRPVSVAKALAFESSDVADVFVAEEETCRISHLPLEPHHTIKPGWEYPTTYLPEDTPWKMKRYTMLVKHDPAKSRIADYLVIRDEISSPETVWWNLHMLSRDIKRTGQVVSFPGQLDVDVDVHFITPAIGEIQKRQWGWSRERNKGSLKTWKGEQYEAEHFGHYIPEDFERGTWDKDFAHSGEMGKWLRVKHKVGKSDWLVVLIPHLKGTAAAKVEKLSPTSAKITLGRETEIIHLGSDGKFQAAVAGNGKETVLLKAGQLR